MKQNKDCDFVQVGTTPVKFYLRELWDGQEIVEVEEETLVQKEASNTTCFLEMSLEDLVMLWE